MPFEVKNVLISDPLDNSAIEILSKANINVQVNTGLKPDQLISEIKVSSPGSIQVSNQCQHSFSFFLPLEL